MKADLHFGDNLEWLKRLPKETVDLCYIDPPFNSKANYNIIIGGAQTEAFGDTWSWDIEDLKAQSALLTSPVGTVAAWAKGMMLTIGSCGMFSYLVFMAERLIEIKRALKPTGSIYVHCDQSANFHIRLLMNAVFGSENFRNEIVWHYGKWTNSPKGFQKNHDTILFYTPGVEHTFNTIGDTEDIKPSRIAKLARGYDVNIVSGNIKQLIVYNKTKAADKIASGEYDKVVYRTDTYVAAADVWPLPILNSQAQERVDYPTQKPLALLDRIILASSNPGDTVMDCFLGSGTTAVAATKNGRNFIGCDITFLAVDVAIDRLRAMEEPPEISQTGYPTTIEGVCSLAKRDKFQFQAWALDMVGYNPTKEWTAKKGADSGIDGKKIDLLENGSTYTTIISVKGGKPKLVDVRDLIGTVAKENAQRGILLTLDEPTKDMVITATAFGLNGFNEAKCVILSARDLLDGKRIPSVV